MKQVQFEIFNDVSTIKHEYDNEKMLGIVMMKLNYLH